MVVAPAGAPPAWTCRPPAGRSSARCGRNTQVPHRPHQGCRWVTVAHGDNALHSELSSSSASSILFRISGSPFSSASAVHGTRLMNSTAASRSPARPDACFFAEGATRSIADSRSPSRDRKCSRAPGGRPGRRCSGNGATPGGRRRSVRRRTGAVEAAGAAPAARQSPPPKAHIRKAASAISANRIPPILRTSVTTYRVKPEASSFLGAAVFMR